MPEWSAIIGFARWRHGRRFRPRWRFPISTVLRPFRVRFIPSCVMSSTESLRLPSCAAFQTARPALGFLPSSRRHRRCPHVAGFPLAATFRPQVFSTSRRLSPPSASRASFIPQPRPGFPFRGLIPTRSRTGSSPVRASLPLSRTCSPVARLPHNTRLSFEALLRGAIRTSKSAVNLRRRRSPLRFFLLQVLSFASRGHAITAHPLRSWPLLRSVHPCVAAEVLAPQSTFSVSAIRPPVSRLRVHQPARGLCLPTGLSLFRAQVPTMRRARPGTI